MFHPWRSLDAVPWGGRFALVAVDPQRFQAAYVGRVLSMACHIVKLYGMTQSEINSKPPSV